MIVDAVTARWGDALYNLAARQGVLAVVTADIEKLATLVARPEVRSLLTSRARSRAEKRQLLASQTASSHPLVQNFANLLFDRQREEVLLTIGAAFRRRTLADANQAEGIVESARPLGAAEIAALARDLGPVLGKQIVLTNRIVPELVGGARVIVQNRMIDYSVQGRLEALRTKLLAARLPATSGT